MKRHPLTATLECVLSFQKSFREDGVFNASVPIYDPKEKWPETGDVIEVKVLGQNVVLVAFVRTVAPGEKNPDSDTPRLTITAGTRLKPFGHALSKV